MCSSVGRLFNPASVVDLRAADDFDPSAQVALSVPLPSAACHVVSNARHTVVATMHGIVVLGTQTLRYVTPPSPAVHVTGRA